MAAAQPYRQGPDAKLKGWHVLLIMLGFFGVMFAVNGVFLYSAITSFPGEDVEKSYVQGLDYNSTLEARRAQAEAGWTVRAGVEAGTLIVELGAAEGEPVSTLAVTATLRRLVTDADDLIVALQPAGSRGRYESELPGLDTGRWEILIEARRKDGSLAASARKEVLL
ncbi:MAG: FixH family protein [Henriciella sp.]|uniref:FixH family protein n=1 Tax=Henriciella sp. TaxID=1968823 RepID=UPI003C76F8D5